MTVVVTFITILIAVISALIGLGVYWDNHKNRDDHKAEEVAKNAANSAISPLEKSIAVLEAKASLASQERERLVTKGMISEALAPIQAEIASSNMKLSMMEENWKQLASEMVKILHHPHPERERMDYLLDHFEDGTLTDDEWLDLRRQLVYIRSWEPGTESKFPIYPGEQTAAAILLQIMKMSEPHGGKK